MAHVFPLGFLSYSWSQGMKNVKFPSKSLDLWKICGQKILTHTHTFFAKRSELDSHLHTCYYFLKKEPWSLGMPHEHLMVSLLDQMRRK